MKKKDYILNIMYFSFGIHLFRNCHSNNLQVAVVPEKDDHSTVWKIDILAGAGPYGLWAVGDTTVRLINKNNFLVMAGKLFQNIHINSGSWACWYSNVNCHDSSIRSVQITLMVI